MKSTILGFAAIGLLLLTSCGQYIYKSTTPKTPLFTQKNDINVQLNMGGAGGEIYGAYAPLNNVGFSACYSSYKQVPDTFNYNRAGRFNDIEFSAVPYYSKDIMRVEMPLGYAMTSYKYLNDSFGTINPYSRMFAQPTFGLVYDNLEFAFYVRITQLQYSDKRYGSDMRYEPGIMLRVGHKNVKVMGQFRLDNGTNYSKRPGTPLTIYQQAEYLPFHVSLGVNIGLNASDLAKKTTAAK